MTDQQIKILSLQVPKPGIIGRYLSDKIFFKKGFRYANSGSHTYMAGTQPTGLSPLIHELQKTLISFGVTYEILKYNKVQLYSKIHRLFKKEKNLNDDYLADRVILGSFIRLCENVAIQ